MAHERIKPEFLFDEDKINKLKEIAPECFEDGKINFETLRQNLGDWAYEDDSEVEHYGLNWPGKKDARKIAAIPPEGTLEPVYGEGLKNDGTPDDDGINDSNNIFIEGENLEVLKILQKSYANKIKMIYIDPPYNTGNDFVYDDDFTEPLQEYLRRTGQIDEEGKPLTTNKKSDGRFHSKWLSMMYPRLRLARNLLKDDGVIFVSIDDNEVDNLRVIMNEIFGEENYVASLAVQVNPRGRNLDKFIAKTHESIIIFTKNVDNLNSMFGLEKDGNMIEEYNRDENNGLGPFRLIGLRNRNQSFNPITRPNLFYPLYISPNDGRVSSKKSDIYSIEINPTTNEGVETCWTWGKEKVENENHLLLAEKTGTNWRVYRKDYLLNESGEKSRTLPKSLWTDKEINNDYGKQAIKKLFNKNIMSFPKSTHLIKKLLKFSTKNEDLILDFFAGSGTTAHAVMDLNQEDNYTRKYICVQLPEQTDEKSEAFKAGFKNISDISKERIRRASKKLRDENSISINDLGFKIFKLSSSSYTKVEDYIGSDPNQLELHLEETLINSIDKKINNDKLITELYLIEGFPLDSKLYQLRIGLNNITEVTSEMVSNRLLICLDENIENDLIEELELDRDTTFICFDYAISNQDKLRLSDKGLIKTI